MKYKVKTSRDYTMHFETIQYSKGTTIKIEKKASLEMGVDTKFQDIIQFEADVKKILNAIKKAYKRGDYINVDICAANYQTTYHEDGSFTNEQLTFDRWFYEGLQDNEDGLHMEADARYTEEWHDLWLDYKGRVIESLESI